MCIRRGASSGARLLVAGLLWLAVFPAGVFSTAVFAQSVSIEAGASWRVGDAAMDLDCAALSVAGALDAQDGDVRGIGDLQIAGEVAAATAALEVGGDWSNHGSFVAGNSVVRLVDRCDAAASLIEGSTAFSTLLIESARGKAWGFEAGLTQSVETALRLAGASGVRLPIRSTQAGMQAALALREGGSQQIAWVDVADMAAPDGSAWLAPGLPDTFDSLDSGNNFRWFQTMAPPEPPQPVSVPTASVWALLLLALALMRLGGFGLRRR